MPKTKTRGFAFLATVAIFGLVTSTTADAQTPPPVPHPHPHPPQAAPVPAPPAYGYSHGYTGQPGGYEGRVGSPYFYRPQHSAAYGGWPVYGHQATGYGYGNAYGYGASAYGDPYSYHFGPGVYRNDEVGTYRFPYYSYRRPWYYPGSPVFARDTNLPW